MEGFSAQPFERLAEVFSDGLDNDRDLGAALCLIRDGETLVDLSGGHRDVARKEPWRHDTIVCMMSVNKAFAALVAHVLIDRGELRLDEPVARYWPEFAAGGKGAILVDDLLSHQAGLVYTDRAPRGAMFDEELMASVLARLPPDPEFAERGAYHSATYGILVGELVRRVTGRPIAEVFRTELAERYGIDYHFAVDEEIAARVSDIHVNAENSTIAMLRDARSPAARVWAAQPSVTDCYNDHDVRRRGFASGAGMGNARAVARLMALLGEGEILSPTQLASMIEVRWKKCALTGRNYRMGRGMMRNSPGAMPMGPCPGAFGHAGAGGSIAFHDPAEKLSFAYSPNLMAPGEGVGERCAELIDTAYACLELRRPMRSGSIPAE